MSCRAYLAMSYSILMTCSLALCKINISSQYWILVPAMYKRCLMMSSYTVFQINHCLTNYRSLFWGFLLIIMHNFLQYIHTAYNSIHVDFCYFIYFAVFSLVLNVVGKMYQIPKAVFYTIFKYLEDPQNYSTVGFSSLFSVFRKWNGTLFGVFKV